MFYKVTVNAEFVNTEPLLPGEYRVSYVPQAFGHNVFTANQYVALF